MDTKEPLLPQAEDQPAARHRPAPNRFSRFHVAALTFFLGLFWMTRSWTCSHSMHSPEGQLSTKVPLEIHIMSKCPDARDCLEKLVVPAMANVSDKVDFRMSYIGQTTDDDGVQCKHGQTECLGNILELCAASEYPDPKIYLGFTLCLSRDYPNIPKKDLVEDCALEHGISFDTLNHCMSRDDGAYGMDMLRKSVTRSAKANVSTSCTIRLDNEKRCVLDGGDWTDCKGGSKPADLIADINQLYDEAQVGGHL